MKSNKIELVVEDATVLVEVKQYDKKGTLIGVSILLPGITCDGKEQAELRAALKGES